MSAVYLRASGACADRLIELMAAPEDHAVAELHRRPLRRRQSLAARACLRALLERETTIRGLDWTITRAENGAPVVSAHGCQQPPAVSISHSADMVACAVSFAGRIGIDIEKIRHDRDIEALAAFVFDRFSGDDLGRNPHAFYRMWAQREALAKAAGSALSFGTSMRELLQCAKANSYSFRGASWRMACWELDEGFAAAVACEETPQACDLPELRRIG